MTSRDLPNGQALEERTEYICIFCEEPFLSRMELQEHQHQDHEERDIEDDSEEIWPSLNR